jgi:hypothetical protein
MYKELEDFWNEYLGLAFRGNHPPTLFRGVTKATHPLVPKIARTAEGVTLNLETVKAVEDDLFRGLTRLTESMPEIKPASRWEWAFLAQHYGMPTRLLDWSTNPLVALFFAVEGNDQNDGAVHYVRTRVNDEYELFDYLTADYSTAHRRNPASMIAMQEHQGKVIFIRPKYSDARYLNQRSIFSCQANPLEPVLVPGMEKIIIPGGWKKEMRERLATLGIATSFIYPGVDGVMKELQSLVFSPVSNGRRMYVTAELALPPN